jgi:L-threonylcarbamoyladenylate synthase
MKTERLSASTPHAISHAVDILKHGGVIAFPTDTVYGLGVPVFSSEGIERLYEIKGRSHTKAIAVLLSSADDLSQVTAGLNEPALRLAQAFWPGPLTIVVPRNPDVPAEISQSSSIGLRVPKHDFAQRLLAETGPMAVTSANLSGQANTRSADEVLAQLDGRIHLLLDGGQTQGDTPSTVVDMSGATPKVLREGPIGEVQILAALS